jgi:hypothetical protein
VPASTTRPRVGSTSIREIAIFSAAPIITRTSRRPAAGYPAPQKKQVGKDGLRVNRQNRARPGVPRSPGLGAATVVLDQPTARPEQVANLAGQAKQKTPLLVMPIQFQRVDVDDPSISGLTKAAPAGSDRVGPPTADWLRGDGAAVRPTQAGRTPFVREPAHKCRKQSGKAGAGDRSCTARRRTGIVNQIARSDHEFERNKSIAWATTMPMLRTIKAPAKAESMPISLAGLRLNGVKAAQSKLFKNCAGFRNQLLSWRHGPSKFAVTARI